MRDRIYISYLVSVICILLCSVSVESKKSKYSADMNGPKTAVPNDSPKDFKKMDNPFRMQKVNMLWQKAVKRMPESKLKQLYADLKSQDKDELLLKKFKSEGQDKSGFKESAIRRQLTDIIKKYGLSDPWGESETNTTAEDRHSKSKKDSEYLNKQIFKYKNLNKLWTKAERIGFGDMEMDTLKEEFQHHQEKLDQYYMLMDRVNEPSNSIQNFLDDEEQKDKTVPTNTHQLLKERHKELKDHYEELSGKVYSKKEFEEEKVQNLWNLAKEADFTPAELKSLQSELHHYENRIRKLRFFQLELEGKETHGKNKHHANEQVDQKHLHRKVKDYASKVSKIHNEIESKILQKHAEL